MPVTLSDQPLTKTILSGTQLWFSDYRALILGDNPTSYWRLGESSGTVAADQKGVNAGTIQAGVGLGTPGAVAGDSNTSMLFNGVATGRIDLTANAVLQQTIEAWVKTTQSAQRCIYSSRGGSGGGIYFGVGGASGTLFAYTNGAGFHSTARIDDGFWHHVVWTWDGTTQRLYVDSVADGTSVVVPSTPIAQDLHLGFDAPNGTLDNWPGYIDEVALYPVALSPSQVFAHYRAGASSNLYHDTILHDNPDGYWRLGDYLASTTIKDETTQRSGTIAGGVTLGQAGPLQGNTGTGCLMDGTGKITFATQLPESGNWSAEAWVKISSTGNSHKTIVAQRDSANYINYALVYIASGQHRMRIFSGNGTGQDSLQSISTTGDDDGLWHHWVGTWDGTYLRIYKDGRLTAGPTIPLFPPSTGGVQTLNIGAQPPGNVNTLIGTVQEIAVYPITLSQSQIWKHFVQFSQNAVVANFSDSPLTLIRLSDSKLGG